MAACIKIAAHYLLNVIEHKYVVFTFKIQQNKPKEHCYALLAMVYYFRSITRILIISRLYFYRLSTRGIQNIQTCSNMNFGKTP